MPLEAIGIRGLGLLLLDCLSISSFSNSILSAQNLKTRVPSSIIFGGEGLVASIITANLSMMLNVYTR